MLSMTSVVLLWLTYSYKPITWELAALSNAASHLNTIFSWEFLDFPIVILTHNVPCRTNASESNKYNRCIICPIPIRNRWNRNRWKNQVGTKMPLTHARWRHRNHSRHWKQYHLKEHPQYRNTIDQVTPTPKTIWCIKHFTPTIEDR